MITKSTTLHLVRFFKPASIALAFSSLMVANPAARAANVWDGGGANGSWSDLANWDSDTTPVSPTALTFAGSSQLTNTNDLFSSGTQFNGITFSSGSGAFVIGGASITLGGGITNSSTNTQTINLDMATTAVRTVTLTTGGGNVVLGGSISGSGGGITTAGAGTLTLSGNNSYTGNTTINTANTRLNINHASALGSGLLTTGNVAGLSIDNTSANAITIANNFTIPTSNAITFVGTKDLSIGGTTSLNASSVKLSISGGTLTLASVNASTTTNVLSKLGTGTLAITGAAGANYQGGLKIGDDTLGNFGTVILGNKTSIGTGAFNLAASASAVLQASADLSGTNKLANAMTLTGTSLTISGSNSIEFGGKITRNAGSSDLTLTNNLVSGKTFTFSDVDINTNAAARLLVIDGAGATIGAGVIANGNSTNPKGLTKNGNGVLTLSGNNTYTGVTAVNAGTLLINGNQSTATGNVSVGGSGTLGGYGTIGGALTTAATSVLTPGDGGAGKLSLSGAANFAAGAVFKMDLGAVTTPGTTYDQLAIGTLITGSTAAGGLKFDFTNLGSAQAGTAYTILTFNSMSGFTDSDLAMINSAGFVLDTSFDSDGWKINADNLQVQFSAVPEPSTWLLLACGLATLMVLRRRRRV